MSKQYILSFDQGTTSSRSVLYDLSRQQIGMESVALTPIYPNPGWVEHDPYELLNSQIDSARLLLAKFNIAARDILSIGITNQRETTIVWDKLTGKPIYNAIVWQDTRTSEFCQNLIKDGLADVLLEKTGLMVDSYFSATKIHWILQHVPDALQKAKDGELLFGTVDSWLLWNLTNGEVHATDVSNASRTMLFNISSLAWDEGLLNLFEIPATMLPVVKGTADNYGFVKAELFGSEIPVNAIVGDQQAALFGQLCFKPGEVKNTYGTGCFMLMNTGHKLVRSNAGLISTIAWQIGDTVCYALEGSIFIGGAVIQWLRDELEMLQTAAESEELAKTVNDTNGVYLVPAFSGLGAPYWNMDARGVLCGLTRGAKRAHIVRAALESIAYQTKDVLNAMIKDSGLLLNTLKVDGGAAENDFLMQFQANVLHASVIRPTQIESTARGAMLLAGVQAQCWSVDELKDMKEDLHMFRSDMDDAKRRQLYAGWKEAVEMTIRNNK